MNPIVAILRPPAVITKWADAAPLTPPLGAAYLAASLSAAGHEVQIVDAIGLAPRNVQPISGAKVFSVGLSPEEMVAQIDTRADIIGVSALFSHDWPLVRKTLTLVRERFPTALIIGGGEHFTAMAEFSLDDCAALDVCVMGEGEETLIELVSAFREKTSFSAIAGIVYRGEKRKAITNGRRARIKDINSLPRPSWHLTPLENYLQLGLSFGVNLGRTVPMLATRGCPYQCTFCSSPTMWTTKWSSRNPQSVLDEIEHYQKEYGATNFDFYDLTMIIRKDWIMEFTRSIVDRGLKFTWQLPSGTRSEVIDEEVAAALYRTGCRNISYAPETGSREELIRIKKKVNLAKMLVSMRAAVKQGLNIKTNIVIGFPGETRRDVTQTLKLLFHLVRVGVHDTSISMFSAYPGSELYRELREQGSVRAPDDDYFFQLNTYKDISSGINWNDRMGTRELAFYRLFGYALFYGLGYFFRPWRFIKTARNVFAGREESRLEKSLIAFWQRTTA